MGHTNADMDSIGSCMGIYRLAKTLNTNAYIVCSGVGSTFNRNILWEK